MIHLVASHSSTILTMQGHWISLPVMILTAVAILVGVVLSIAGCLWLALLVFAKIEEGIINYFGFNREFIAFAIERMKRRRDKKASRP